MRIEKGEIVEVWEFVWDLFAIIAERIRSERTSISCRTAYRSTRRDGAVRVAWVRSAVDARRFDDALKCSTLE
jgi:hypothetical protein